MKAPRGARVIRAMTRAIKISVLAAYLSLFALPVLGYFQWLHIPAMESAGMPYENRYQAPAPASPAIKYPYPDKEFVMTDYLWRKSMKSVQFGNPDWYDVEIAEPGYIHLDDDQVELIQLNIPGFGDFDGGILWIDDEYIGIKFHENHKMTVKLVLDSAAEKVS